VRTHRSDEAEACWACGRPRDAASAADPADDESPAPGPGDVSLCFGCSEVAIFTGEGLRTREPTEAERAEVLADPGVVAARGAILVERAERPASG
jgi:hypothetical protein